MIVGHIPIHPDACRNRTICTVTGGQHHRGRDQRAATAPTWLTGGEIEHQQTNVRMVVFIRYTVGDGAGHTCSAKHKRQDEEKRN